MSDKPKDPAADPRWINDSNEGTITKDAAYWRAIDDAAIGSLANRGMKPEDVNPKLRDEYAAYLAAQKRGYP